jgi:hypothetical protein
MGSGGDGRSGVILRLLGFGSVQRQIRLRARALTSRSTVFNAAVQPDQGRFAANPMPHRHRDIAAARTRRLYRLPAILVVVFAKGRSRVPSRLVRDHTNQSITPYKIIPYTSVLILPLSW